MTDVSYRRAAGAVWAFLIVGVLVKLAELTWTFEHRWLLPWDNEIVRRSGQISLLLRFSWQEFAIAAGLLALLAAIQHWRPTPGRWTRVALGAGRLILALLSLATVFGISYYSLYHTHFTLDDLEYLGWAPLLLESVGPFDLLSVRVVSAAWLILTFGLPWVAARDARLASVRTTAIAGMLLALTATALQVAGRPNLAEARLEPNPVVWMLFGSRVSYADLPPVATMAPIGVRHRQYDVAVRPRNVVVVVLESVPAGALSAFNPDAPAGRRLFDEFGSDITVFDQIFAVQPNSTASIFSVLTGRSPVPTTMTALTAMTGVPTISDVLKSQGFHSQLLLNGPFDDIIQSLAGRNFDRALNMHDPWPNQQNYARISWGYDDQLVFDEGLSVLKQRASDAAPTFLFLHTNNPHHPYASDRIPGLGTSDDGKVRHRLLVRHTMDKFTEFYRELKASGLADSTLVLAYGDHGEAFGEHEGNFIHSKELYWENLHVPVLLLHPTRLGLPSRISQLGSLDDLTPTVLDILGLEPGDRDGMSLLFEAPDRLVFSMTDWGPGQIALRDRQYAYILSRTGRELLFDRKADPFERQNLAAERPEVAAAFRARFGKQ